MKLIFFILVLLSGLRGFAYQEIQGGGGGLSADGHYMTFYSSKIPLDVGAIDITALPGLKLLTSKIMGMTATEQAKQDLLWIIFPSDYRTYLRVNDKGYDQSVRATIADDYSKISGVTGKDVILFGLTDRNVKTTALFPEFFSLTELEQATILMHESMWLAGGSARADFTVKTMIALEMATQAYFENPQDPKNYYNFYYMLDIAMTPADGGVAQYLPYATWKHDLSAKLLRSQQFKGNQLLMKEVVGDKYLPCLKKQYAENTRNNSECEAGMSNFMIAKVLNLPQEQMFLRAIVQQRGVVMISDGGKVGHFTERLTASDLDQLYIDFDRPTDEERLTFPIYKTGSSKKITEISFQ